VKRMTFGWDGNLVYMHGESDAWKHAYDPRGGGKLRRVERNGAIVSRFRHDADG